MLDAPICVLYVYVSTEALQLQSEALWSKRGRRSAQLEELMRSLVQRSGATAGQHDEAKLQGAYLNMQSSRALTEHSRVYTVHGTVHPKNKNKFSHYLLNIMSLESR